MENNNENQEIEVKNDIESSKKYNIIISYERYKREFDIKYPKFEYDENKLKQHFEENFVENEPVLALEDMYIYLSKK